MAHRQTTRDGFHTHRQAPAALEAGMDCRNPLHCVRDYDLQPTNDLYEDAYRVADETVTFLRSFSKRLRRFEAQTGEFAQDPGPPSGIIVDRGTHGPYHPAQGPTAAAKKPNPVEPNNATGDEASPRQHMPRTPKYSNSPSDTTTLDPQSISMDQLHEAPHRRFEGARYDVPNPGTQNQNQPPRAAGRCMDSVEPPEMHTDGVSEQPHPDIRQETTTAATERETVAFPPKDYV